MNDDKITASKADSLLDEINNSSVHEDEPQPEPKTEVFKKKENRWILYGGAFVGLIVIISFVLIVWQVTRPKSAPATTTEATLKNQPVGDVPDTLQDAIDATNNDIEKSDVFQHSIELEDGAKNKPKNVDLDGFDTDKKNSCEETDTACYRIHRLVGPDDCAPKDQTCFEALAAKNGQPTGTNNSVAHDPAALAEEKRIASKEYTKTMTAAFNEMAKEADAKEAYALIEYAAEPVAEEDAAPETGIRDDDETSILDSKEPIVVYQKSGDRLMGVSEIALSSKIEGEVSLSILGGEFVESLAIGRAKRQDDYMRIELYKWVLPDGRECKLNAIALDRETTLAAVASRVDHHTLYRYGWWGVGTALSAIGKAAQMNVSKEIAVSEGVAIESTQADAQREAKIAVGELGREIGEVMKRRLDMPSTVYVDVNEQMGVFFIDRVTSKDCK